MAHCAKNLLHMYLTLVVVEIVQPSLFELPEMYMRDTSLQSGLQMKAHPFWIARALTDPNFDVSHPNCIRMQYSTLASTHYIDDETYEGWDSTSGNIWREDRRFDPVWTHTDCIMDAWQFRICEGTMNPQMQISMLQIANITATMERFEAKDDDGLPSLYI